MNNELEKAQGLVNNLTRCLEAEVRIIKVKATLFILDSSISSKLFFLEIQ
jgi:hypothetical protein